MISAKDREAQQKAIYDRTLNTINEQLKSTNESELSYKEQFLLKYLQGILCEAKKNLENRLSINSNSNSKSN
jgi:hypothetical protein